jgi:glyoxylase-like metal-dependent hydrolase (beta-lactamase superfamily II)
MENQKYLNVIKIPRDNFTVHCVQSPIEGEMTNAQLIETKNSLLLIDTLQLKPHADELREYILGLGKPLKMVIVTHYHPDHWFGAATFKDYPLYALQEVIDRINLYADFVLDYHRKIHGERAAELIPSEKVTPTQPLQEGLMDLDGLKLNFIKVISTESPCNLMVELPDYNILLAQDIIYNKAYPYFGEKTADGAYCFDNWIKLLNEMKAKNYEVIVPGHGDPTDPTIIPVMIEYLEFAKAKLNEGLRGDVLINTIKAQYPDYQLPLTLIMSDYMLFNEA